MKKILIALAMATTLFLAGCASATDSKPAVPTIPVTITGGGTYATGTSAALTANPTYTGTGTLTYKWSISGTDAVALTKTLSFSAVSAATYTVAIVVTDGSLSGTASTTVTFQ